MSVLPSKILLATDCSEDAAVAARAAISLSKESGAELHLVHVWHDVPSPYARAFIKRELQRQSQEILDEQVQRIEGDGGNISGIHLRQGRISDEVIKLGEELEAGLLVVGSRGHGRLGRLLMGSHSEEIVHHTHLPVLVLRRGAMWPPARLVIGEDYSEDAKKAGELAASLAGLLEVRETVLVHTYPRLLEESLDHGAADQAIRRDEERLEARVAELEEILGYQPRTKFVADDAAVALLEAAQEANGAALIAVGSRGLGAASRMMLGSTSTKVVRAAPGPVLIHPHSR